MMNGSASVMDNVSQRFRRILATVKDPLAGASPALARAALIAQASGAELVLFHAIDVPICADAYTNDLHTLDDDRLGLRRDFLAALEQLARPLRADGLQVRACAEWDYPAHEAILRSASQSDVDLIVTDHRHSRPATPWSTRSTDRELLRLSPIPLLIVKSALPYSSAPVLAAVDPLHRHAKPADLDNHICQLAQRMAALLGNGWHVLHATGTARRPDAAARIESAPLSPAAAYAERARGAVLELLRTMSPAPSQVHVLAGEPTESILGMARQLHSPLTVMGAVSRSGLPHLLIGDTAERLIDALPCDLLVARPDGFAIRYPRQVRGMKLYSVLSASPG